MRWCVVIRALKTTTQLALPTLSISVSTIWGTFTLVWSWVAWIRSGGETSRAEVQRGSGPRGDSTGRQTGWQKRSVALPAQGAAAHLWPSPQAKPGRLRVIYWELLLEADVFPLKCMQMESSHYVTPRSGSS